VSDPIATHPLITPDGRIVECSSEADALAAAEQELGRLRANGWTVRQMRLHAGEAFRPTPRGWAERCEVLVGTIEGQAPA